MSGAPASNATDPFCPRCEATSPELRSRCLVDGLWRVSARTRRIPAFRDVAPRLGESIADRYALQGLLGVGGMGVVYEAFDQRLRRDVALKMIRPSVGADPEALARDASRFEREAHVLARLNHPGIVAIHDFGVTTDGACYLVMERLEGRPLADLVPPTGLPAPAAVRLARQIAEPLAHAHEQGICHRDLKPPNIFQTEGSNSAVKLLDFGLARLAVAEVSVVGEFAGTYGYMAPEQFAPVVAGAIGPWTDQYALASTVYRLLAGRLPLDDADGPWNYRHKLVRPDPLPGAATSAELGALSEVLQRALSKRPQQRYPSVLAFVAALEEALHTPSPSPSFPVVDAETVRPDSAPLRQSLEAGMCLAGAWCLGARLSTSPDSFLVAATQLGTGRTVRIAIYPGLPTIPIFASRDLDRLVRLEMAATILPLDHGTCDIGPVGSPFLVLPDLETRPLDETTVSSLDISVVRALASDLITLHDSGMAHGDLWGTGLALDASGRACIVEVHRSLLGLRTALPADDVRALGSVVRGVRMAAETASKLESLLISDRPTARALLAALAPWVPTPTGSPTPQEQAPTEDVLRIVTYALFGFDAFDDDSTASALRIAADQQTVVRNYGPVADLVERWPDGRIGFAFGLTPEFEVAQQKLLAQWAIEPAVGAAPMVAITRRLRIRTGADGPRVEGSALKVAARLLEGLAPGERAFDIPSWRLAGAPPTRLARVSVAGRQEPFRISGGGLPPEPSLLVPEPPLVGREGLLASLLEAVSRAMSLRRARALFLSGDPGMGKTRLLAELGERLEAGRGGVHVSRGAAGAGGASYGLLRNLFGDFGGLAQAGTESTDDSVTDDLCLAGQLLGNPWLESHRARFADLDARSLERRQRTAILRLARRAVGVGWVLLVDGWQAADAASRSLLRDVLIDARQLPLVLVATDADPAPLATEAAEHARRGVEPLLVHLSPIVPEDMRRLTAALLPELSADASTVRAIATHAEGNPGFVFEMVADMRARGLDVEVESNRGDFMAARLPALPPSLERVVETRLHALPERARRALVAASVAGPAGLVSASLLAAMESISREDAAETLDALHDVHGLLVPSADIWLPEVDEPTFTFDGAWVRRVAQATLPPEERVALAGRAEVFLCARSSAQALALRAWHAEQAAQPARAARFYGEAATLDERAGRVDEAIRLLGLAIDAARVGGTPLDGSVALMERRGDLLYALGRYAAAAECFDVVRMETAGSVRFRGTLKAARSHGFARDNTKCRAALDACRAEIPDSAGPADRLAILTWSAWSELVSDQLDAAEALLSSSPEDWVADASHPDDLPLELRRQIAVFHNVRGMIRHQRGQWDAALVDMEVCLALNETVGDLFGVAMALNNLGDTRRERKETDTAIALLTRAVELAEGPLRNLQSAAIFQSNLARCHLDAGRFDPASEWLGRASALEEDQPLSALRAELLARQAVAWSLRARAGDSSAAERAHELARAASFAAHLPSVDEVDRRMIVAEIAEALRSLENGRT